MNINMLKYKIFKFKIIFVASILKIKLLYQL